ncbi:hypothetical protein G9A89_021585 [Geosiphon pyriformis]|nr:hypothetical protein G9A89_021585 [Geosiphon pyriformis]
METITINQWGRMNNTQVEDMKNRVKQTILEKEQYEAMSKIMAHCLAMWNNDITLVKDLEIRVGYSIKDSLPERILAIKLRKKLTKLWFQKAIDKTITTESLKPAPTNKSTVAESESIGANHLGFAKSLFQHYSESAFNFYVNEKIAYLLGTPVNTESARETFYHKLIQNTSLLTNHNFASIITKINKEIKHYIQQRYPITYTSKGKGKLQTLAVTLQWIQPPTWKKYRIESPINLSYYYTLGSTINIASADTSTSNATSTFGQFPFQNFGTASSWEVTELKEEQEEEEKKFEDQEFIYQNPIPKIPEFETMNVQTPKNPNQKNLKIETSNFQAQPKQNNQNPEAINQLNLPPNIVIEHPPIDPIAQPLLQQLIQQPV